MSAHTREARDAQEGRDDRERAGAVSAALARGDVPTARALLAHVEDEATRLHLTGLAALIEGDARAASELFAQALVLAPDDARLWGNLGNALAASERERDAVFAYEEALARAPSADVWFNLGRTRRALGDLPGAVAAYEASLALSPGPEGADALCNLGLVRHEQGLVDEAARCFHEALARVGPRAALLNNLGNALRDGGDHAGALAAFDRAIELAPGRAAARYNRFAVLFDDRALAPARRALEDALAIAPQHAWARFHLALILDLAGDDAPARHAELEPFLAESLALVRSARTTETRFFADTRRTLAHAMALATVPGHVLELGVRHGHTLRFLATLTDGPLHGFDAFEGLPEAWGDRPPGLYTTGGALPAVPPNVTLHAGWFHDTLPRFLAASEGPVRLVNVDSDLYASARTALALLSPRIVPGTVLVFDEYLANPGWQEDEHRALTEWAREDGRAFEYVAFSPFTRQAVVRVTR